jgi:predicted secreted protein
VTRRRALLLVAGLLLLQGCASLPGSVVRVEESDSDKPVELRPGQVLEVRLKSFPGRSRTLSLGSRVQPVLRQEGRPTFEDDTIRGGISGTGSFEAWRFRAMQPGRTELRMDYRTQWDAVGPPTRSVTFDVVVGPVL